MGKQLAAERACPKVAADASDAKDPAQVGVMWTQQRSRGATPKDPSLKAELWGLCWWAFLLFRWMLKLKYRCGSCSSSHGPDLKASGNKMTMLGTFYYFWEQGSLLSLLNPWEPDPSSPKRGAWRQSWAAFWEMPPTLHWWWRNLMPEFQTTNARWEESLPSHLHVCSTSHSKTDLTWSYCWLQCFLPSLLLAWRYLAGLPLTAFPFWSQRQPVLTAHPACTLSLDMS